MKYLLMKAIDNNNFGIDVGVVEVAAIPDNLEHAIKHMKLRANEHCFILKFDETAIPSVKFRLEQEVELEAKRKADALLEAEVAHAESLANDLMVDKMIERLLATKARGVNKSSTPPKAGN
jgi:hypothetical protein